VSEHYAHGDLLGSIHTGITALGKTPDSVTVHDLAPVDEFHIGGRQASEDFLDQLNLSTKDHVLDIGCGLGGASRFVASQYGSRVTGIDLTAEYIETGKIMCEWVTLGDQIALHQGNALSMPFEDGMFDNGFMMHVGMNIEDKAGLCSEVYRVLRPGASFGMYDVMQVGDGELTYPVPWATTSETSAVASPEQYKHALQDAGFTIVAERNRRDFALTFFEQLLAKAAGASGPPPLGIHILMGASAHVKVQNMVENISDGRIAPVELIAQKS
jgi:ubiquinone/menaquinone biosynthesis C-methylase UbiE